MAEPQSQVKTRRSHYKWDLRLPFFSIDIRNFTDCGVLNSGILAKKDHCLDLKMEGWFNPRYGLRIPTYPDARFQVPEAKVQLISGGEVKREYLLTFTSLYPEFCEGDQKDLLEGKISAPVRPSDVPVCSSYLLRLIFTVELKSWPFLKDPDEGDASSAVVTGPGKSAVSNLLFLKPTDVMIVCGKKEFFGHKDLLAEKSPVFRQMFENEMSEALTGKVVLDEKEIAPNSLLQLLHFLYNGKMVASKEVCKDLFVAAEKYDMQGLKGHCESYLAKNLKPADAVEFYGLAETHQGTLLKTKAVELLKLHKSKLFPNADAFIDFGNKYPQLMFQLFTN